jgi:hypothetical protein
MLVPARIGHGLFEKLILIACPNTTPSPRKKNQGVKKTVSEPRTAIVTMSWIAPQTTNVITNASVGRIMRWSGE